MNRTLSWVCVIFVILIIGVPALVVTWNPQVQIGDMFKLGTDLQGGTSLIYELKPLEGEQKVNAKNTAGVILDRIDPKRLKDYVVRPIGKNRLEIRLPGRRVRVNIESKELTTEFLLAEATKERARVTRGKTHTEPAKIPEDWREFTGGILLTVDLSPPLTLADIQDRISEGIRKLQAERLRISWLVRPTRSGRDQHRRVQVWVAEPYADEAKAAWAELVDRGLAEHSDLARVKRLVEKAGHLQLRMLVHREKDRGKGKWDQFVADKQAGRPLASPLYRWYPARIKKRGLTQARQRANWTDKASQMTRASAV
ncbi:MAG: hypothetical protein QF662_00860, partial [Phycisphaerae bacterium]|nr:hypothetical protein [Phycisphaerae bacterium]